VEIPAPVKVPYRSPQCVVEQKASQSTHHHSQFAKPTVNSESDSSDRKSHAMFLLDIVSCSLGHNGLVMETSGCHWS